MATALAAFVAVAGGGIGAAPASAAPAPTVVSLTFDNQWSDQMVAAQSLRNHNMAGTFYVISGWIGLPGFLSLSELQQINSWGSEIGGKTVNNANLSKSYDDESKREVCQGRKNLMAYGFQVTSFAYPFAEYDAMDQTIAAQCGFNSARGVGDLAEPIVGPDTCSPPDCPYAESLPPADPYSIRTPSDGEVSTTLAEMKTQVTNAVNNGGGLLAFSFHHICVQGSAGCDPVYSVSPQLFDDFLTWLSTQTANGVVVKTIQNAIGGSPKPVVEAPSPAPSAVGVQALQNPTLTTADAFTTNRPACFTDTGFGTNTRSLSWSRTGGQGGGGQLTLRMSNYSSGDAKVVPTFDLGHCSPSTTAGHNYSLNVYYKSTVPVIFTLYGRSSLGAWSYWTGSPTFPATNTWTKATWLSPPVPSTYTAMSYGMTLNGNGTVNTSNYSLTDTGSGPPPAAAIGVNGLKNPTLVTPDGTNTNPYCFTRAGYGTNTPAWSWTSSGGVSGGQMSLTMSNWASGDAKLVPTMDSGNCAPTVTPGYRYSVSLSYKSSVPVFFTLYSRDAAGNWGYWTQSPTFPARSTWGVATFTTPLVPSTVNGASFGMTLSSNGTLSTSNYSLVNTGATS